MIINYPNERIYAGTGIKDPLFITDIVNANETLKMGMLAFLGFKDTAAWPDFAIITGIEYDGGSAFSEGYYLYKDNVYRFPGGSGYPIGTYISPITTNVYSVKNGSGGYMAAYKEYTSASSITPIADMPILASNMDAYRSGNFTNLNATNIRHGQINYFFLPIKDYTIGAWNMYTTNSVAIPITSLGVANTLAGAKRIKAIAVQIIDDDDSSILPIDYNVNGVAQGSYRIVESAGVWFLALTRLIGGIFETVSYDTSANRGFINVTISN